MVATREYGPQSQPSPNLPSSYPKRVVALARCLSLTGVVSLPRPARASIKRRERTTTLVHTAGGARQQQMPQPSAPGGTLRLLDNMTRLSRWNQLGQYVPKLTGWVIQDTARTGIQWHLGLPVVTCRLGTSVRVERHQSIIRSPRGTGEEASHSAHLCVMKRVSWPRLAAESSEPNDERGHSSSSGQLKPQRPSS